MHFLFDFVNFLGSSYLKFDNPFHIDSEVAIRKYVDCQTVVTCFLVGSSVEFYLVLVGVLETEVLLENNCIAVSDNYIPAFHLQEGILQS